MKKCISEWIRLIAAERPLTQAGKIIAPILTEIGKKDPSGTKTNKDEFETMVLEKVKEIVGHGMSENEFEDFQKNLDRAKARGGTKAMLGYLANYMLAGTGQRVLKEGAIIPESHKGRFTKWCKEHGFKDVCQEAINAAFKEGGKAKEMALFVLNFDKGKYKKPKS